LVRGENAVDDAALIGHGEDLLHNLNAGAPVLDFTVVLDITRADANFFPPRELAVEKGDQLTVDLDHHVERASRDGAFGRVEPDESALRGEEIDVAPAIGHGGNVAGANEPWMKNECLWNAGQLLSFRAYDSSVGEYYLSLMTEKWV